ncbi:hypothetical protein [Corynebacterium sp. A21]|uniref:hypothetical protein n=1 Tax=Corynebacterium sp. A21 TaxID=3457318 RepID=UPI003FD4F255
MIAMAGMIMPSRRLAVHVPRRVHFPSRLCYLCGLNAVFMMVVFLAVMFLPLMLMLSRVMIVRSRHSSLSFSSDVSFEAAKWALAMMLGDQKTAAR